MNVTNNLLTASDKGLVSVLVLLDLSAAFDTINHHIPFQRLEHSICIKGNALSPVYHIDFGLCPYTQKFMVFNKDLCLDQFYSP